MKRKWLSAWILFALFFGMVAFAGAQETVKIGLFSEFTEPLATFGDRVGFEQGARRPVPPAGVVAMFRRHGGKDIGQLRPVANRNGEAGPPLVQARIPVTRRHGVHSLHRCGIAFDRGPQRQLGQDAAALVLAPGERVSHGLERAPGRVGIAAGQAA